MAIVCVDGTTEAAPILSRAQAKPGPTELTQLDSFDRAEVLTEGGRSRVV